MTYTATVLQVKEAVNDRSHGTINDPVHAIAKENLTVPHLIF